MTEIQFEILKKKTFEELGSLLSTNLHYHSLAHTQRVLEKTEQIALAENVTGKDLLLLKIAALFHDYGFIYSQHNHEEKSCLVVKEKLKKSLNQHEIELICGMIMATKIPQQPTNLLEEILADADLEYLGTDDFEPISDHLFKELQHKTPDLTKEKWDEIQVKFFQEHNYFTSYAKEFLKNKKAENLKKLINKS